MPSQKAVRPGCRQSCLPKRFPACFPIGLSYHPDNVLMIMLMACDSGSDIYIASVLLLLSCMSTRK